MSVVELTSPLPLDECLARLESAADRDDLWNWYGTLGSKSIVGRVSGRSVRLRKRIGYRNSFQTILRGTLEPHEAGTFFRGKVGVNPLAAVFMAAWFSGVVLLGGPLSAAAIGEMNGGGPVPMKGNLPLPLVAVIPVLMAAFGIGLWWFGRWLASDEERYLIECVANMLNAKVVETESRSDPDF